MINKLLFSFVVFVAVTGCNPAMNRVANDANPETEAVVNTVVVDLDAVSKASGAG